MGGMTFEIDETPRRFDPDDFPLISYPSDQLDKAYDQALIGSRHKWLDACGLDKDEYEEWWDMVGRRGCPLCHVKESGKTSTCVDCPLRQEWKTRSGGVSLTSIQCVQPWDIIYKNDWDNTLTYELFHAQAVIMLSSLNAIIAERNLNDTIVTPTGMKGGIK